MQRRLILHQDVRAGTAPVRSLMPRGQLRQTIEDVLGPNEPGPQELGPDELVALLDKVPAAFWDKQRLRPQLKKFDERGKRT